MSFTSFVFILYFLPIFFLIFWLTPRQFHNFLILIASYVFYGFGAPLGAMLLMATSILDYSIANAIHTARLPFRKKFLLTVAVIGNLGMLGYFKYSNFFVQEFNSLLGMFGSAHVSWQSVVLPFGISFIVFHKISYIVDIYYGRAVPTKRFIHYANFIAFFPKILQGPIVRYHDIADQLERRACTVDDAFAGLNRFMLGFSKKILIADALGEIADKVFALKMVDMGTPHAWLGILAYTMQLYFDFSGYSDMAIGLSRMMGFKIPENFNRPYLSPNFTAFWRRWHISLGRWFMEYLYIPLGGNRVGKLRNHLNLWTVFLISGLWHGANWTFIIWGLYHGFFLVIDRLFWIKVSDRLGRVANTVLTFFFVMIGWVFFRSNTMTEASAFLSKMFAVSSDYHGETLFVNLISNRGWFILALAIFLSFFPNSLKVHLSEHIYRNTTDSQRMVLAFFGTVILFGIAIISMVNNSFKPFIYFRF